MKLPQKGLSKLKKHTGTNSINDINRK